MPWPRWLRRWMASRHGDTSGTAILHYRRVYILPTRQGFLFATILIVMWLAAINYNNNMAFLLTFLLAGVYLAAMNHTFRNLVGLRVTPLPAQPVFAGQAAVFPVQLNNEGRRSRTDIGVGRDHTAAFHDIAVGERARASVTVPTAKRGRLKPGVITLDTSYPGGLFRAWSWVEPATHCLVYPSPETNGPEPPQRPSPGNNPGPRGDGDDDFDGLRRYRRGDSIRRIAWKATTARELQVKAFSGGKSEEWQLSWADTADLAYTEQRLSRLCHWVLEADRRGRRYALSLPGHEIPPGRGASQRDACLSALAEVAV